MQHAASLIVDSNLFFDEESESGFRFALALQVLEICPINCGKIGKLVKRVGFGLVPVTLVDRDHENRNQHVKINGIGWNFCLIYNV